MSDELRPLVFFSHSTRDKMLTHRIADELQKSLDVRVWLDFHQLMAGDPIQATIDAEIAAADILLVVWTHHAAKSPAVQSEIESARRHGVRLIAAIVARDENGGIDPPLSGPLAASDTLGIDFHHFPTGVARLVHAAFAAESARLPAEIPVDAAAQRMVRLLQGYLHHLACVRPVMKLDDDRAYWVEQIIGAIEQYVRAGGDTDSVRLLLEGAQRSTVDDAEGIGLLVTRLEALLGEPARVASPTLPPPPPSHAQSRPPRPPQPPAHAVPPPTPVHLQAEASPATTQIRQQIESAIQEDQVTGRAQDGLRRSAGGATEAQVQARHQFVLHYVQRTPDLLDAMAYAARAQGLAALVQPVIDHAAQYFALPDDLIPDAIGVLGLVDDAYLAQRYVQAVSERVAQETGRPLIDVDLAPMNALARCLLSDDVAVRIDASIEQSLRRPEPGMATWSKVALGVGGALSVLALAQYLAGGLVSGAGGPSGSIDDEARMKAITGW